MAKYEILSHTADLKIRIFGDNIEDLFVSAVSALSKLMRPEEKKFKEVSKKEVEVESLNLENLLIDFLNEVLYLSQTNKEFYSVSNIRIYQNDDFRLEAALTGKKVRRFGEDIKAATYHDLNILQKPDNSFEATVLFDI